MQELSDRTRCAAISALLGLVDLSHAWTPEGPAPAAAEMRSGARALSADQRMMLVAAWALWDGSESIRFAHLWTIDRRYSEALSTLILATGAGEEAVAAWLERGAAAPGAAAPGAGAPGPPAAAGDLPRVAPPVPCWK